MSQSRIASAVEACTNIAVGAGVALGSQLVIFPLCGVNIPLHDNIAITGWFTLVSLARSYVLRRLFNGK